MYAHQSRDPTCVLGFAAPRLLPGCVHACYLVPTVARVPSPCIRAVRVLSLAQGLATIGDLIATINGISVARGQAQFGSVLEAAQGDDVRLIVRKKKGSANAGDTDRLERQKTFEAVDKEVESGVLSKVLSTSSPSVDAPEKASPMLAWARPPQSSPMLKFPAPPAPSDSAATSSWSLPRPFSPPAPSDSATTPLEPKTPQSPDNEPPAELRASIMSPALAGGGSGGPGASGVPRCPGRRAGSSWGRTPDGLAQSLALSPRVSPRQSFSKNQPGASLVARLRVREAERPG